MFSLDFISHMARLTNDEVARLPRIHLCSEESLVQLLAWRDKHKDAVRSYKPIVTEGTISFKEPHVFQYFKYSGDLVLHMQKTTPEEYIAFTFNTKTWETALLKSTLTYYSTEEAMQDIITVHASAMAYLNSIEVDSIGEKEVVYIESII
jgi:hypothetical protein